MEKLQQQKTATKTMFVDLPLGLMSLMMIHKKYAPDLLKNYPIDEQGNRIEDAYFYDQPLFISATSFAMTVLSAYLGLRNIRGQSAKFHEKFNKYYANQIKGSFGWIPFVERLKDINKIVAPVNFMELECSLGSSTEKLASVELYSHYFDNGSTIELTSLMFELST